MSDDLRVSEDSRAIRKLEAAIIIAELVEINIDEVVPVNDWNPASISFESFKLPRLS